MSIIITPSPAGCEWVVSCTLLKGSVGVLLMAAGVMGEGASVVGGSERVGSSAWMGFGLFSSGLSSRGLGVFSLS